jgi:hypothetical protein
MFRLHGKEQPVSNRTHETGEDGRILFDRERPNMALHVGKSCKIASSMSLVVSSLNFVTANG